MSAVSAVSVVSVRWLFSVLVADVNGVFGVRRIFQNGWCASLVCVVGVHRWCGAYFSNRLVQHGVRVVGVGVVGVRRWCSA